jgi:hypothetical protein
VPRTFTLRQLGRLRAWAQGLGTTRFATPMAAVSRLLAVQAQDYLASLWAVGRRVRGATQADLEAALERGELVRTWPMRGTLHLVAAADVRWLLALCAPRASARAHGRHRQLGLDERTFERARAALDRELGRRGRLTRSESFRVLDGAGISSAGQRGIHLIGRLAHDGFLCLGPRDGKQPTVLRLDDWVPPAPAMPRADALVQLARRYVGGHGPANAGDLAWWAGLGLTEARLALGAAGLDELEGPDGPLAVAGSPDAGARGTGVALLPAFDELLVGFAGRDAFVATEHRPHVLKGGLMAATLAADGRAVGTWRRVLGRAAVTVELSPFAPLAASVRAALEGEVQAYGDFLGVRAVARWPVAHSTKGTSARRSRG